MCLNKYLKQLEQNNFVYIFDTSIDYFDFKIFWNYEYSILSIILYYQNNFMRNEFYYNIFHENVYQTRSTSYNKDFNLFDYYQKHLFISKWITLDNNEIHPNIIKLLPDNIKFKMGILPIKEKRLIKLRELKLL